MENYGELGHKLAIILLVLSLFGVLGATMYTYARYWENAWKKEGCLKIETLKTWHVDTTKQRQPKVCQVKSVQDFLPTFWLPEKPLQRIRPSDDCNLTTIVSHILIL
jgi:hypothetical protein